MRPDPVSSPPVSSFLRPVSSSKHLIQEMFLDRSRPLYRAAGHYPLGPIAEEHWRPFIQERFAVAHKPIAPELVTVLCQQTEGHPFYTQHLCHTLWEHVPDGRSVVSDDIDQAIDLLLARESHAYATLWELLTKNEKRLLRGLANEPADVQPFSSDFTRRYGLRSSSNAQRASEGLLRKDVIDRSNGNFTIVDRFSRLWVHRTLA